MGDSDIPVQSIQKANFKKRIMVKSSINSLSYCFMILGVFQASSFPISNSVQDCPRLQIDLKNDVLSKQGISQGNYEKHQIVNGRRSWKKATRAVWFVREVNKWVIGDLKDIGTKTGRIASKVDFGDRIDDASNEWDYWSSEDKKWQTVPSGDIIINCSPDLFNVANWDSNLDYGVWNNQKLTCRNWYAWKSGDAAGKMSTTLIAKGKGELDFGNCWNSGVVEVYLDGSKIASAGPGESKVLSFDYNDGSKLEIREVNNAIIQINTLLDLEAIKDQEDLKELLKELEKLPSKQLKLQLLKKKGVEVVAKIIKMSQKTLAEVDKLIEESDSAMKNLRYSFRNIDLKEQNFTRTIFTRFNDAQLDLLDARRELVSLASETIRKCKKIENGINYWKEKYAARLYKSQFKELKRLVEKTKSTIKIAREKYDSLKKNWVKIDEDIETFQQKVDRALDRNSAEYKYMISKLEDDKYDIDSWQIGAVFLDIFGCFGFCSTLVVNQKKEANRKIEAKIKEYEDEMGKMSNKIKDAYKTIQRLDLTSGTAITLLTLEENLVILWETAANGMEDTIEDLSEATLEQVKDADFIKVQFATSVADLKSAAENFLRFVNPDNPSLLN